MTETKKKPAFTSPLMSVAEAEAFTTLSRTLLRNMANEGMFPPPINIGTKRIAYARASVEAWLEERMAGAAA